MELAITYPNSRCMMYCTIEPFDTPAAYNNAISLTIFIDSWVSFCMPHKPPHMFRFPYSLTPFSSD